MTEQLPYQVLRTYPDFEVRRYPEYSVVECSIRGDFLSAGNRAFAPLFQFISGNNSNGQRIAMTAPVLQAEIRDGEHRVAFVMPASMNPASVPVPRGSNLSTKTVPGHDAVVRRYSGSWSERKMREQADQLRAAVQRAGLTTVGEVTVARFDPPWKPGFLKRNEILLALAEPFPSAG
ncbi:MAG: SOUL family heme-binding protein [Agromyces sp.]